MYVNTPYLGQICIFPFDFAPRGWALCNGQLLAINQNQALYSLLGTTYGGNGRTTFALPDLRGRVALHKESIFPIGQTSGQTAVTLSHSNLPMHNHALIMSTTSDDDADPSGNYIVGNNSLINGTLASPTIGITGGSQPHDNMQPYLVLSFCIAITGLFPSRM
jgi:microcystin-dependent protein